MRPIPLPQQSPDPARTPIPLPRSEMPLEPRQPQQRIKLFVGIGVAALGLMLSVACYFQFNADPVPKKEPPKAVASVWSFDPNEEETNPFPETPPEAPAEIIDSAEAGVMPQAENASMPTEEESPPPSTPEPVPEVPPASPSPPPVPAKPPLKNPFEGFAQRIALPDLVIDKPHKLGPVKIPEDYECVVYLLGGDTACSKRSVLAVEPVEGSARQWDVHARAITDKQAEKVARLEVKDQALWLTWNEDAAEHVATPALANCLLKISAGPGTHSILFREAMAVDPIPVLYEKRTYDWELPTAPFIKAIQVELDIDTPPSVPRTRFLGSSIIPVSNGQSLIEFGLRPGERFLKLQIQTRLDSRGVHVTVTPWVQVTGQPRPVALTPRNVGLLQQSLAAAASNLDSQLKQLPAPKKGKKGNVKDPNSGTRNSLNGQLGNIRTAQRELQQLISLKSTFESQCRIKAKVNYAPEGMIAELLRTK